MRALFLGEGEPSGPSRYLSAILRWAKIPFDHRPDQARIPKIWRQKRYDVALLSDYRYRSWTPCARQWLVQQVTERGTGLVMIGGWASFTGLVGGYAGTDIERLLPVTCLKGDDRVQRSTGALLVGTREEKELKGAPIVCGYHRARPKPGTEVPYSFRDILYKQGRVSLGLRQPALVLGRAGRAKTAAFLTDCAPHWAGGLVDWGKTRLTIPLNRSLSVEVGTTYLHFFRRILERAMAW